MGLSPPCKLNQLAYCIHEQLHDQRNDKARAKDGESGRRVVQNLANKARMTLYQKSQAWEYTELLLIGNNDLVYEVDIKCAGANEENDSPWYALHPILAYYGARKQ